ncbi:unnamed protein product [Ilex paraguariensis]|uniref:ABC transmembrane type-1 domain-containing protein n=1 Tax=Ilex paraguariensis TaxID=185542 RepID=A0ABC8UWW9_9AQUA
MVAGDARRSKPYVANDAVANIRTVASFGAEESVMAMYKKKCEGPLRIGARRGLISGVFFALSMTTMAISQSSSFAPDSGKAKVTVASIFSILDRKSKIDPRDESGMTLENVKGEIELRHISFRYPTQPGVQVF